VTSPRFNVGRIVALLAAAAIATAGCSETGSDTSRGGSTTTDPSDDNPRDCLTADEVQAEIDKIAGGFESSQEEVEAKQRKIREIRAREC
jgi:hypothetical protein